ncbi:hypothetical protein N9064_00185 [bacterium]|nr:hypothetical protein [bacterium]
MRLNYVIATYSGPSDKKIQTPKKEALKIHLKNIANTKCTHINQVTIMKAVDENCVPNSEYYNVNEYIEQIKNKHNIPVKIVECENYCYSFGQWLLCYEQTKEDFDYYIFQEDDYFPSMDNYDNTYLTAYREAFPENIGVLCGLVLGKKNLLHTSAPLFVSNQTLQKLYSNPLWKGSPRKAMHDIFDYQELFSENELKIFLKFEKCKGALYQVSFSFMFNHSDIISHDIMEFRNDVVFLYWEDGVSLVLLYTNTIKRAKLRNNKNYQKIKKNALFLPFQWEI